MEKKFKNMKTFEEKTSKKYVYILSSDGHRDSVSLEKCALDEKGIKKLLIEECLELGNIVIEDSIKINFNTDTITYQYKDFTDDLENGKYGFFQLEIV